MKTATYKDLDGKTFSVEYDENAPCIICGEPVMDASMGGTVVCPACDCGRCRYCGTTLSAVKEEFDGGRSLRAWREHVSQCGALRREVEDLRKRVAELEAP